MRYDKNKWDANMIWSLAFDRGLIRGQIIDSVNYLIWALWSLIKLQETLST